MKYQHANPMGDLPTSVVVDDRQAFNVNDVGLTTNEVAALVPTALVAEYHLRRLEEASRRVYFLDLFSRLREVSKEAYSSPSQRGIINGIS